MAEVILYVSMPIGDSLETFSKSLANVDTILPGRATCEDRPRLKQGE